MYETYPITRIKHMSHDIVLIMTLPKISAVHLEPKGTGAVYKDKIAFSVQVEVEPN